jgi:hypothetical protein
MSEFRYVGEGSEQAEEEADVSELPDAENEPSPHEGEEGQAGDVA